MGRAFLGVFLCFTFGILAFIILIQGGILWYLVTSQQPLQPLQTVHASKQIVSEVDYLEPQRTPLVPIQDAHLQPIPTRMQLDLEIQQASISMPSGYPQQRAVNQVEAAQNTSNFNQTRAYQTPVWKTVPPHSAMPISQPFVSAFERQPTPRLETIGIEFQSESAQPTWPTASSQQPHSWSENSSKDPSRFEWNVQVSPTSDIRTQKLQKDRIFHRTPLSGLGRTGGL